MVNRKSDAMNGRGVIYHGSDAGTVLEKAYEVALAHMQGGAGCDAEQIQRFTIEGTYPNFFLLKKADDENEISIDATRQMLDFLAQKPSLPGGRAVLIKNFEHMSRNAANSILKALEEPPEDTILILTTTRLLSIIPTIRSRCLKIRVQCEDVDVATFPDAKSFVNALLRDAAPELVGIFVDFLASGCKGIIEFSKTNADNFELFLDVAIAYCSFVSTKNSNLAYARRLLELQSFSTLTKNTYPDKQAAIILTCNILAEK
ncbi:MAG: hypothetical protein IJ599_02760 [Alphaproteobacteria bacterium]|nr:hypothetical protein [Alphaproteobacteria bacterium]